MLERMPGRTRTLIEKIEEKIHEVSNYQIPQNDDTPPNPEDVILVHRLFMDKGTHVLDFILAKTKDVDISFTDSEIQAVEEKIELLISELSIKFLFMRRAIVVFASKTLTEIAEDEKRFFKKIKGEDLSQRMRLLDIANKLNDILTSCMSELDDMKGTGREYFDSVIDARNTIQRATKINEDEERVNKKNEQLLNFYQKQIDMMIEAKKQGIAIESEILGMREKLIMLEKKENSDMLQDLMKTLDSI